METKEITLMLVGHTGNGKSATGNSILKQQVFKTTASTSVTKSDIAFACCSFDNVKINVSDCAGIDTDNGAEEVLSVAIETIKQALNLCNYTFSALVIVLKYGARFTKQESDFLKIIRGVLGENVIRDFGICIITHGDNFEYDNEDEHLSFKEWCDQQDGEIKNLFEECSNRCVLFNNRTKEESLKDSQLSKLIAMVPKNQQYNEDNFKAADPDLQKLITETKMPRILKETQDFLGTQRNKIKIMKPDEDISKQIQTYKDILTLVNEFEQTLSDNTYGAKLQQPINEIKIFKMDLGIRLKSCERICKPNEAPPEDKHQVANTLWAYCTVI